MSDNAVVVALLSLAGTMATVCITFLIAWMQIGVARRHDDASKILEEINDAVNHRHLKVGTDAKKLYDLAWDNFQRTGDLNDKVGELVSWKRSYDGGPFDTGDKVRDFVDATDVRLSNIEERLTDCQHKRDKP